jgi:hypothetical protein
VDFDALVIANSPDNALDGRLHIEKQHGIVQARK